MPTRQTAVYHAQQAFGRMIEHGHPTGCTHISTPDGARWEYTYDGYKVILHRGSPHNIHGKVDLARTAAAN